MTSKPGGASVHEVITMGLVGVDLYPHQAGVGLADVDRFGRYLGGSPTNVAVAAARYGHSAAMTRDPDRAADALLALGVQLAVIKQGPTGVLARDGHADIRVPPIPVTVINGLGAWDAFGGALCHGLLKSWGLEATIRFANAAGAIVSSRIACSDAMPTSAEVAALLEETSRA